MFEVKNSTGIFLPEPRFSTGIFQYFTSISLVVKYEVRALKIKLFQVGADRFFMAAILYPRLQWAKYNTMVTIYDIILEGKFPNFLY